MGKRDLIWGNTDSWAIFAMELFDVMDESSPEKRPYEWQSRSRPGTWSWDIGQRVEEYVVDSPKYRILVLINSNPYRYRRL